MTLQITSAKLLVHLVDLVFHNKDPNPQVGRDLLVRILQTLILKFDVIRGGNGDEKNVISKLIDCVDKEMKERKRMELILDNWKSADESDLFHDSKSMGRRIGCSEDEEERSVKEYYFAHIPPNTPPSTVLLHLQHMLRPMIHGMKTIFWCISSYSHQREKEHQRSTMAGEEQYPLPAYALVRENEEVCSAALKMTQGERDLVDEFMRVGLDCLCAFTVNVSDLDNYMNSTSMSTLPSAAAKKKKSLKHHREVLESFVVSFTSLESYNFRSIIAPSLPHLMEKMCIDGEGPYVMFSHLLLGTGKAVSYEFFEIALCYLMENLESLGKYEKPRRTDGDVDGRDSAAKNEAEIGVSSNTTSSYPEKPSNLTASSLSSYYTPPPNLTQNSQNHFRIFILIISSMLKFPRNEAALTPHLQTLVKECIQRSTECLDVGVYFGGSSSNSFAWPGPYLNILRLLFRTLTNGKFDQLSIWHSH